MLTKSDIKNLKEIFATKDDLKRFATKDELKSEVFSLQSELKSDILNFKDEILHEIRSMRQELIVIIGYKDQIEDHEVRLEKLENKA